MKPCLMNERWTFVLPDHVADWDAMSMWERERNESMEEHLHKGMVLYDIGAEHGAQSAIYQSFVGPENMVLIEPSAYFWPNIRLIWEHNDLATPLATVEALIGDKDVAGDFYALYKRGWPPGAGGPEAPARSYAYIHDPGTSQGIPQWKLDTLAPLIAPPDAITIDVEGAELLVLKGAEGVLTHHRPLVWVSVHPDMLERDYGTTAKDLRSFMASLGYKGSHLATDHEEHHLFLPVEHPAAVAW